MIMKVQQRNRELTDEDIAACQPEAIWLEKKKVPFPAHIVLWVILVMLVSGVIWASVATVDKIVTAEGKLVTTRPNIVLKPLERTVIDQVHVLPGQMVEKGQILITFDPTINRAEYQRQQEQKDSLVCQKLRLEAENEGRKFILPPEFTMNESALLQNSIFMSRQTYLQEKTRYYDENIRRYRNTAASVQSSLLKHQERLVSMGKIEDIYNNLRKGIVATKDIIEVQLSRMNVEIEVEKQKASLVEYQQQEQAAIAEKNVFLTDWKKSIAEELVKVERDLISLNREMEKTVMLASTVEMRSPCRAVVHEISPFQDRSAVREAESLITLTPLDVPLEAEVDVSPQDIGWLAPGVSARVKMDAFPFQQHGILQGTIRNISTDTFESRQTGSDDEERGQPGMLQPKFRIRLTLAGNLRGVPATYHPTAGMKLRCEMKVGERTVLSYLMNPFLKALDESLREP